MTPKMKKTWSESLSYVQLKHPVMNLQNCEDAKGSFSYVSNLYALRT